MFSPRSMAPERMNGYSPELREPEPRETLSSYLACWRGEMGVSKDSFYARIANSDKTVAAALQDDPDFPAHPNWIPVLSRITRIGEDVLAKLGTPIGPWHLHSSARNLACLGCLDDWATSSAQFKCKSWSYATTTTCYMHGLPLVEVPAVGWEWQDLSAAKRRANTQLMLNPSEARRALEQFWSRVADERLSNALFRAEMSAWVSHNPSCGLSQVLRYGREESAVWEDLLVFLCTSWRSAPALSISAASLPIAFRWNVTCFGDNILQPMHAAPDMHYFRRLSAPRRRSCVLVAYSIIRKDDCPLLETERIFRRVLKNTSAKAYLWLLGRSLRWMDSSWQSRLGSWFRLLDKDEQPTVYEGLRVKHDSHRKLWGL